MLRELWNRVMNRSNERAIERESEREIDSPAERRFASQTYEGYQADQSAEEHLGGFDPDELIEEGPPR